MKEKAADHAHLPDAYAPAEIAALVERAGVAKARLGTFATAILGMLGGAFIAFGGMFYTLAITGSRLGFGPTQLAGGIAFSLGLILVVIAGAELFTGNNLIVMAWADGKVSLRQLLRNWAIVYAANFVGTAGAAVLVHLSGALALSDGAVGKTAIGIAQSKMELDFAAAFFRGVLCNALVCLAVWLAIAARGVTGKVLAILFPISAFVAVGFEHSVANMYFIPLAMLAGAEGVTLAGLARNLVPVTLGNILGGSFLVALVYWLVYGRRRPRL